LQIQQLFDLSGKRALVTGSRRGIGFAMAMGLAEAGADIIGVSAAQETGGSEIERQVTSLGREFAGYACDFASRDAVYAFIEQVKTDFPVIDIVINNAGIVLRKPAVEYPDEYWDRIMEINLNAQFILSRELGKEMVARGAGKIIFTASLLSFQGGIFVPAYSASKGAVVQLARALANEWAAQGVQVNAIAPGYVNTDNTEALRNDPERSSAILARIPAGRWGEPDDIKGAAVFLASRASDYMNGSVITIDGGWMSR
jgi:2-dehydro-3-deoxy-D-gluconate 5-dehydrogenase